MDDTADSSIEKNINFVSRNAPIALVVGAAGFIGSHLSEKLLDHNIQVIGVDNFLTGKKQNLEQVVKNKKFHLLNASAQNLKIDLPRLDYIFLVATDKYDLSAVFSLAKGFSSKLVLVTSIDLYDSKLANNLSWYKHAEVELARFAKSENINARIVRLSEVFGPKMHFRNEDPVTRLIQAAVAKELQHESAVLNFSSRALYIDDAISLIVKSMMSGGTALKIFDGCLPSPVKVSEIKQILMDPLWYENRNFQASELPPWPTPNLDKTIKALSWQPRVNLVKALKETINYFTENEEVFVPSLKEKNEWGEEEWEKRARLWKEQFVNPEERTQESRTENQEGQGLENSVEEKKGEENEPKQKKSGEQGRVKNFLSKNPFLIIALLVIFYALVYPVLSLGWGIITFKQNLASAAQHLSNAEFDKSIQSINSAEGSINQAREFISSLEILRKAGLFSEEFKAADSYLEIGKELTGSSKHAILGTQALYDSLKTISGELTADPKKYLTDASSELQAADSGFSEASVKLKNPDLNKGFFNSFQSSNQGLVDKVEVYTNLVKQARSSTFLLPEIIGLNGKKSYLVLLQNSNELRPTGGFIGSVARIDFEGGKLKKLEVQDVYAIDGSLKIHVEPPKEIKEDLGQNDWYLRDSNWEPDYPTAARQAAWFYGQETGVQVDGVIAVNLPTIENLLDVIGPLNVSDYKETINSSNLFPKTIAYSEQGFFPGSQAKKNFLSALSTELFNQIFFVPKQNWPGIIRSLGRSFNEKQLLVYLADPKLFSYLVSENFAGALPRQGVFQDGRVDDFLAIVEANLGADKANYYLDRNIKLATGIGKEGEVSHILRISYTNKSPSAVWPAGNYKNRLRIYLPFGTKLEKASWGEKDITNEVNTFVDYGRTGYSMLLELNPREQKTLVLNYQLANRVSFKDNQAGYSLNIIKQAGTLHDPLEWNLTYPINFKIQSSSTKKIGSQEQSLSTDLSTDRKFEVSFTK